MGHDARERTGPPRLTFRAGTLELEAPPGEAPAAGFAWDDRTACWRAPAARYAETVLGWHRAGVPYEDRARAFEELAVRLAPGRAPRDYQREALDAWRRAGGRGVVVLPTGAGKTLVALLAIEDRRRSALVVAPTLDLVRQWCDELERAFGVPVGVIGGGTHEPRPITVTTYDSAYLHMEHLGARWGLIVFDECHHLPSESYALAAEFSLAPYRLGLTATPERADGRDAELLRLIGPYVLRREIRELSGEFLAPYDTRRVAVELGPAEREEYEAERALYRAFVQRHRIPIASPGGFSRFLMLSTRSDEGRRAHRAYRRQRELALNAPAKLDAVGELLERHAAERTLVFSEHNALAYAVARRFLVPVISHQTPVRERSALLGGFASGEYGVLATSKVLNEGVDVPDASVAIVVSGSGSTREHVQRLGRILRPRAGKRAILYEIVSASTGETRTSERRRDHDAYRG
ncbi:MAG: DEAD/DEAH box helicase family protein [Polyangiaceae bacterium]|nr:DEAD/DEAH box helicase family protein [Polyangiaceae bacterium]